MIAFEHVSKWYGNFQVLDDCSTSVAKSEVVVVCGPFKDAGASALGFLLHPPPDAPPWIPTPAMSSRTLAATTSSKRAMPSCAPSWRNSKPLRTGRSRWSPWRKRRRPPRPRPPGPGAAVDDLGMSARAGSGTPAGPDPRGLATNRGEERVRKPVTVDKEPGRNDPCPCGSGKKYKKCHG